MVCWLGVIWWFNFWWNDINIVRLLVMMLECVGMGFWDFVEKNLESYINIGILFIIKDKD